MRLYLSDLLWVALSLASDEPLASPSAPSVRLLRMKAYRLGGEAWPDSSNLAFFSGTAIVLKGSWMGLSWKPAMPAPLGLLCPVELCLAACLCPCLAKPVKVPEAAGALTFSLLAKDWSYLIVEASFGLNACSKRFWCVRVWCV